MLPIAQDINTFLLDFGVEAEFNGNTFLVIFDAPYILKNIGNAIYQSESPEILCNSSDVSTAQPNDVIIVDGVSYHITELHPDGTGMTSVILSKDSI